jgi:hypothetical protein
VIERARTFVQGLSRVDTGDMLAGPRQPQAKMVVRVVESEPEKCPSSEGIDTAHTVSLAHRHANVTLEI